MMIRALRTIAALQLLLWSPAAWAQTFEIPPNDGYVTDEADIFTDEEEATLEQRLTQYTQESGNEIAILSVTNLQGEVIEDVAVEIGRKWGVGSKENDNGILLLIAYEEREMFLATGYGLEGALPDIVAKGIIDTDLIPAFRDANYYTGVNEAVTSIQKHITGEYEPTRYEQSDGAGFGWMIFLFFMIVDGLGAFLARSKSWWAGGALGFAGGVILTFLFNWWVSIPALFFLGLLFDYIVSRHPFFKRMGRPGRGGGWRGGGRSGGGGFGGFGGGSFGGGGAKGRW